MVYLALNLTMCWYLLSTLQCCVYSNTKYVGNYYVSVIYIVEYNPMKYFRF